MALHITRAVLALALAGALWPAEAQTEKPTAITGYALYVITERLYAPASALFVRNYSTLATCEAAGRRWDWVVLRDVMRVRHECRQIRAR